MLPLHHDPGRDTSCRGMRLVQVIISVLDRASSAESQGGRIEPAVSSSRGLRITQAFPRPDRSCEQPVWESNPPLRLERAESLADRRTSHRVGRGARIPVCRASTGRWTVSATDPFRGPNKKARCPGHTGPETPREGCPWPGVTSARDRARAGSPVDRRIASLLGNPGCDFDSRRTWTTSVQGVSRADSTRDRSHGPARRLAPLQTRHPGRMFARFRRIPMLASGDEPRSAIRRLVSPGWAVLLRRGATTAHCRLFGALAYRRDRSPPRSSGATERRGSMFRIAAIRQPSGAALQRDRRPHLPVLAALGPLLDVAAIDQRDLGREEPHRLHGDAPPGRIPPRRFEHPAHQRSRPLRHVPSETSWSASSVNSGSMASGSLASRASTYFWTTARTAVSSADGAAGSPATRGIDGSIRIRMKCGRAQRRMAETPCTRPGSVPSHPIPPIVSARDGASHPSVPRPSPRRSEVGLAQ